MSGAGDIQANLGAAGHDAVIKSTARSGARRMVSELRALIPPSLSREEQEALLRRPGAADLLGRNARILFHTSRGVVDLALRDFRVPDGGTLRPARRIGTYRGAPNRIGFHPHYRDDAMMLLPVESMLELAWLRRMEFLPSVTWMQTQPFVIVWPHEDRCIWRIPDLLLEDGQRWRVLDIKPDEVLAGSAYLRLTFGLTSQTLAQAGLQHGIAGSMTRAHRRTLLTISAHRWVNPDLRDAVASARAARRRSAGGVIDSVDGGGLGVAVLYHLLTRELAADFTRPLRRFTPVTWPPPSTGALTA
jgi:hypothetical protein